MVLLHLYIKIGQFRTEQVGGQNQRKLFEEIFIDGVYNGFLVFEMVRQVTYTDASFVCDLLQANIGHVIPVEQADRGFQYFLFRGEAIHVGQGY